MEIFKPGQPDKLLLTFSQAHALVEVPNLERRIKRDIQDALKLAYTKQSKVMFVLHRENLQDGISCCEVITD